MDGSLITPSESDATSSTLLLQLRRVLQSSEFQSYSEDVKNKLKSQWLKQEELHRQQTQKTQNSLRKFQQIPHANKSAEIMNENYKVYGGKGQVIQISIDYCKDVKDKLEKGKYWVKAVLKDRIGGNLIKYEGNEWRHISNGYWHEGRYINKILEFNSKLMVVVPEVKELAYCMVYCLQILNFESVVVAESYFPVVDKCFCINQGSFKIPLIKGILHETWKYQQIEEIYRSNIENWLCNLYFKLTLKNKESMKEEENKINFHKDYQYSVSNSTTYSKGKSRIMYILAELKSELILRGYTWSSVYFSVFYILFIALASRYAHFSGQWLYLKAEKISVSFLQTQYAFFRLNYNEQINFRQEVFVLLSGNFFQIIVFSLLSALAALSQILLGKYPRFLFKFTLFWGVFTILDPLLTLFEALLWGFLQNHWKYDPFRFYFYFEYLENSGVNGALLTIFLYLMLSAFASVIFFYYAWYLHMNGSISDIYTRLNGLESDFFLPHDSEVSQQYLEQVCQAAKSYQVKGNFRIINAITHLMTDNFSEPKDRSVIHIIIHNTSLNRNRSLHRHFLILPEGAIVELSENSNNLQIGHNLNSALQ